MAILVLQNAGLADPMFLDLPDTPVTANFDWNHSLGSYWKITLSGVGAGYSLGNGVYQGWCADVDHSVGGTKSVYLVETYDDRLFVRNSDMYPDYPGYFDNNSDWYLVNPDPTNVPENPFLPGYNRGNLWYMDNLTAPPDVIPYVPTQTGPASNSYPYRDQNADISPYGAQDKINWILNNWETVHPGPDNPSSIGDPTDPLGNDELDWKEIQTAMWYYVDGQHYSAWTWNQDVADLVVAADANDGWTPNIYTDVVGVIMYIPGTPPPAGESFDGTMATGYQAVIIPVAIPEPGMLLLLGTGLIGIAGYGRMKLSRRKKA
jgi:hypothetical protein